MTSPIELENRFWKALGSDRTVMLGIVGADEAHMQPLHMQPMTAMLEGERSPIWFFSSTETDLVRQLGAGARAVATFASRDNGLFATVHGDLAVDNNPAMIDDLWSKPVAAWFDKGRDDPRLALLRFDPDRGEIWEGDYGMLTGFKMMFGMNIRDDVRDRKAEVNLR